MMASIRRVCRNIKRRRDALVALRRTGAPMQEPAKGFWRWRLISTVGAAGNAGCASRKERYRYGFCV